MFWVLPVGLRASGSDTLAGASIASVGTLVPSGGDPSGLWLAETAGGTPPIPATLAVQAADSSASGTIVAARCSRPKRFLDIRSLSPALLLGPKIGHASHSLKPRTRCGVTPAPTGVTPAERMVSH